MISVDYLKIYCLCFFNYQGCHYFFIYEQDCAYSFCFHHEKHDDTSYYSWSETFRYWINLKVNISSYDGHFEYFGQWIDSRTRNHSNAEVYINFFRLIQHSGIFLDFFHCSAFLFTWTYFDLNFLFCHLLFNM